MADPRLPQVIGGTVWPISDSVGVNGDFFMLVGTNNTFIVFGPKANNTWVGVPQCTVANQQQPNITYLQYLGDNQDSNNVALPTNGTGVPGQLCLLLDVNGLCCGIAVNMSGVWTALGLGFGLPNQIYNNAGSSVIPPLSGVPEPGVD